MALIVLAPCALIMFAGLIAFPPVEKRQKTQEGYAIKHTRFTRGWEFLPIADWGVTPLEKHNESTGRAVEAHIWRFGFIGLTERYGTSYTSTKGLNQAE